jgi:hypothetical protein
MGKTLMAYKNLDTSQSHLDCRGCSCHQRLLSTWHGINHMMRLMVWWCILLTAKHENTLTVCILTFQLNQGTFILGCVQMDSISIRNLNLEGLARINVITRLSNSERCLLVLEAFRPGRHIQVIFCSLFLLVGYIHGLQLTNEDVYEIEVHIFIYIDTRSE